MKLRYRAERGCLINPKGECIFVMDGADTEQRQWLKDIAELLNKEPLFLPGESFMLGFVLSGLLFSVILYFM